MVIVLWGLTALFPEPASLSFISMSIALPSRSQANLCKKESAPSFRAHLVLVGGEQGAYAFRLLCTFIWFFFHLFS